MVNLDTSHIDDQRSNAIASYSGHLLVCMAGPGTGKTFSFLQRAKKLTTELSKKPDSIVYLTFVKQIADAFSDDYDNQDDIEDNVLKPRVSTLHSFACRILRNKLFLYGYSGPLYFANLEDKSDIPASIFLQDLLFITSSASYKTIPSLRNHFALIKDVWQSNNNPIVSSRIDQNILNNYFILSRTFRVIDWDHAIPFATQVYIEQKDTLDWLKQYKEMFIDEYQDFNSAEQNFLSNLIQNVDTAVIVGDDDQSLYSSRGSDPAGLRSLFLSPPNDIISLTKCHRCKGIILNAANTFLSSMHSSPRLMTHAYPIGGTINCYRFGSTAAELRYLKDYIMSKLSDIAEGAKLKEGVVCIFATKKALNYYYQELKSAGVPCFTKIDSSQNQPRNKLKVCLELVAKPAQRFIERLLIENFPQIKRRHKTDLLKMMLTDDISIPEATNKLLSNKSYSTTVEKDMRDYVNLITALSSKNSEIISLAISSFIGINNSELTKIIALFLARIDEANSEVEISNLCDLLLPDSAEPKQLVNNVLFTTMHGAKGLTRKTVILPGLERAWLPGVAVGADLKEKERMFYVSITRATDNLLITYPMHRQRKDPLNYGADGLGEISPFVTVSGISDSYHE